VLNFFCVLGFGEYITSPPLFTCAWGYTPGIINYKLNPLILNIMFIEATLLIAPNVGQFASIIDDRQRVPTKEELDFIIKYLENIKKSL
jgi:hypothetical protein